MDAGARRIAPWTARFDGFVKHRKSKSIIPTVSRQLRYSLTRESVHKPGTWNEAPYAVAEYSSGENFY